jgi:hypothetical protein
MGDEKQSKGRDENAAIPTDEWPSKGLDDKAVARSAGRDEDELSAQPYAYDEDARQKANAEKTGRTQEVTGEARTFKPDKPGEQPIPGPHDLEGPAGDPAEGKRPGGDSYPS